MLTRRKFQALILAGLLTILPGLPGLPISANAQVNFEIVEGGGLILDTSGEPSLDLQAGFAVLQYTGGEQPVTGSAVISVQVDGKLVSELLLPAVEAITSARVLVVNEPPVSTAIVVANPGATAADVSFYFSDDDAISFDEVGLELEANEQIIAFIDGFPFSSEDSLTGTLTISSTVPVAINAIRLRNNDTGDSLLSSIPVTPLPFTESDTRYLPIYIQGTGIDGDVISSTVMLVNPTDAIITGTVFVDKLDGQSAPFYNYVIQPRSYWRSSDYSQPMESELPPNFLAELITGSVRIEPATGTSAPAAYVLLGDFYEPESGVARTASEVSLNTVSPGTAFRYFIENIDFADPDETLTYSFNITDVSGQANSVMFELMQLDGTLLLPAESIELPAGTGTQLVLGEILPIPAAFTGGLLRISSTGLIVMEGLRSRTNSSGEPKLMVIPGVAESAAPFPPEAYFPLATDSGGSSTAFYLFSAHPNSAGTGILTSYGPAENAPNLAISERSLPITASDLLTGTFNVVSPDGVSNTVTTFTFDGTGAGVTSEVSAYSEQGISSSPATTMTYVAAQNSRLALKLDPGADEQFFGGLLSQDGDSVLLVSTNDEPGLLTALKTGVGLSNSLLNGEYIAGVGHNETSSLAVLNFDGAGAGTLGLIYVLGEGEVSPDDTIPLTYTVTSSGQVEVMTDEAGDVQEFIGMVSSDGKHLNLAEVSDPAKLYMAAHKTGAGLVMADLVGKYVAGALAGESTIGFALDFDGQGNGSVVLEDGSGNTIMVLYDLTYDLESDGQLSMTIELEEGSGTLNLRGILSDDQSRLALVAASGTEPILILAFKE